MRVDYPNVEVIYDPYKLPLKVVPQGFGFLGTLGRTKDGMYVQCHVCGKLYKSLGIHAAKMHGIDENQYRDMFKLAKETPLVSEQTRANYINSFHKLSKEEQERRINSLKEGRAAELRATRVTYVTKSLEQKNREGRCPDQLIDKIQLLTETLGHTPSLREFRNHYGGFVRTVYNTFGSWANAIKIADLPPARAGAPPQYNRHSLIILLQAFEKRYGRQASSSDIQAGLLPSQYVFMRVFGSWANALQAAGYTAQHSRNIPEPVAV